MATVIFLPLCPGGCGYGAKAVDFDSDFDFDHEERQFSVS
jgi:hypothetical protein